VGKEVELTSQHKCFNGTQSFYKHESTSTGLPMTFSVYEPPQAKTRKVPVLFYLAGLTCTEETFMIKGGAQRYAAEHGIMLVSMDTSPRRTGIKGAAESWDFGHGAGFYIDAIQQPWAEWAKHDASALMRERKTPFPQGILIDQGLDDEFLDTELLPHHFESACWTADQPLTLRRHSGYDHNYYFISTFMADHIAFHAATLNK
jgi:S-formylglutathione hydrolase FrmB